MVRLRDIVVDCLDPQALAAFWEAALDGYALRPYDDAEIARLASQGLTPETDPAVALDGPGPTLFFQKLGTVSTGRGRLHFDLMGGPREDEVARLCELGARVREVRSDHSVLLDPEGNAFCVLDPRG
ncbi:MAG: VOC family protein [Myxococcota bacterium]|nr:VOC family protein [Myxococcota bacterium]